MNGAHFQRILVVLSIAFALATTVDTGRPDSASAKPYYEGKTLKILVSSSPGGGTDTAGRLVGRFLPQFLPGNPAIIIQNMPGGGGTVSNNYFTRRAKPDGLFLLQDSSSGLGSFSRGGRRIKYDPRKYGAIGSIMRGGSVLMVRKEARHRLTDPKAKPVVVGDTDGIRTWVSMTVCGAEYLGWNPRWIVGYAGTGEIILAFRQGEIEMMATANAKLIKGLVKDGVVDIITQAGKVRRKDFPNVPTFEELLGNKRPSGVPWQAYRVWAGPSEVDKFLVAPPGTPDKTVGLLREAFQKMAQDREFISQATKFFGNAWIARGGKETQALIREVTTVSQEVKGFLRKIRVKYGLPTTKPKKRKRKS
ncbi:MAG: Bug family tripartite tricarboxylate transporter substrate binding protein [Candidatus Binatia bacterium]